MIIVQREEEEGKWKEKGIEKKRKWKRKQEKKTKSNLIGFYVP